MEERQRIEQAIAAQEALRATLGDEVVDATLIALRARLAALPKTPREHRRQVTILFADVSGYTGLAEERDAEVVRAAINEVWRVVDATIERHGGEIDKHMGDAVLAVWGTREAREDDPERAIRAGLEIVEQVRAVAFHGVQMRIRVGINTGLVVVGSVGSRGETTVLGDAVNVASRLQQVAGPDSVLVSHHTYRHVRGVFEVREGEPVHVRGRSAPVTVYEVLAAKTRAYRLRTRGVEGVETPMIGRDVELARLMAATRGTIEERAGFVTVLGEAGIGKSRLLDEYGAAAELLPERLGAFYARSVLGSEDVPYGLARDLFAFRFEILESDPSEVAREKLEGGVARFVGAGPAAVVDAHRIGQLIGFDFSDSPAVSWLLQDPRRLREAGFDSVARFLRAVAAEMPAVFMLEDIHWADDGSLDLIQHVARTSEGSRLLFVCTARPLLLERRPDWSTGLPGAETISIQPLERADSRRLVEEILREAGTVPVALRELVVSSAEGNPFYLEELVKMLVDQGVIRTDELPWRIDATRLVEARVPPTLTGVLQARLDRLSEQERAVLQRASVVGREFWREAVARLDPDADVDAALDSLKRKELVFAREASAFQGTPEFAFKHALLRDVTYETVLLRDRVRWHALAAEWLVERAGEGADRFASLIAGHWERAARRDEAARWYARAAEREAAAYAPERAVEFYRKAIGFAGEAGGKVETGLVLDWRERLGKALGALAWFEDALAEYDRMRDTARVAGDRVAEARAWNGRAFVEQRIGDYQGVLGSAARAEALAAAAGDSLAARIQRLTALIRTSDGWFRLGDADQQMASAERALQLAESLADAAPRERALSLKLLAMGHQTAGRFDEARRRKAEALEIFRGTGDRQAIGMMLNSLGETLRLQGDFAAALAKYHEALALAEETGNRPERILCLSNIAGARIGLGEFAAAEADARRAIELAGEAGYHVLPEAHRFLAEALLGQGRLEEAETAALRALALSRDENPDHLGHAWRALGRVAGRRGRPVEVAARSMGAGDCLERAVEVFERSGMEPERARTLRDWALLEREAGDPARGDELWRAARAAFHRLGMGQEVERMEEEAGWRG